MPSALHKASELMLTAALCGCTYYLHIAYEKVGLELLRPCPNLQKNNM